MGSAVALAWAGRHPEQVRRVVCAGAPLYPDAGAARDVIGEAGPMARVFLLDTHWAQRACALSCAHRTASGLLAALAEPSLPVTITRRSVLHTWPAYRDALNHLVLEADWPRLLTTLADNGTPVTLLWGDQDPIGDRQLGRRLTSPATQTITTAPGADHHLPITDPSELFELIGPTQTDP